MDTNTEFIKWFMDISAADVQKKIGICGQAPSDFPEFCEFLVSQGIDSISLEPDSVIRMKQQVAAAEKRLRHTAAE